MTLPLKRTALLGTLAAAAWATMYKFGRTWGSTVDERARYLPGDELIPAPRLLTDHATTIKASPDQIWPWLVQMGWHRGGWYTYRWVDRLFFPANPGSADEILPRFQHLEAGDRIPDGPPETDCFYIVELLEPAKMMVLRSWTHLPQQIRKDPRFQMEWTWAFYLDQIDESQTRFLFRVRGNLQPMWLRLAYHALIVPADFVMARSMCLGLRRRVESSGWSGTPVKVAVP